MGHVEPGQHTPFAILIYDGYFVKNSFSFLIWLVLAPPDWSPTFYNYQANNDYLTLSSPIVNHKTGIFPSQPFYDSNYCKLLSWLCQNIKILSMTSWNCVSGNIIGSLFFLCSWKLRFNIPHIWVVRDVELHDILVQIIRWLHPNNTVAFQILPIIR